MRTSLRFVAGAVAVFAAAGMSCARPTRQPSPNRQQVLRLWPGPAPGSENWSGPEETADVTLPNLGRVHIITNVTVPTLTVVRPARQASTRTAMIVVPGGAFRALPWDLDGMETAGWLTAHGITAFVLKYRVRPPARGTAEDRSFDDFARRTAPAQALAVADAEQAVRLVRSRAEQFGVAPDHIGMIGFSAGAMTTAIVADAEDSAVRPDFAVSLYGAFLKRSGPSATAAPLFIVAAADDREAPPARSLDLLTRWRAAKRPAELHLYEKGGHGFAFRHHGVPADRWPVALQAWLVARGELPPSGK